MNIITKGDVEKFLKLLELGLKNGQKKSMKSHTSTTCYDGINVPKSHFVSLEFSFIVDADKADEMFVEDDFDLSDKVKDLLK